MLQIQNTQTMSSREIAELTNKEHRNVTADIKAMFAQLEIDTRSFQYIYKDSMNRDQIEYLLDKELCNVLLDKYKGLNRVPHRLREESSLKTIEQLLGITLIRQYRVLNYRIDGYDPVNNVAYEIDEPEHKYKQNEDDERQRQIEKILKCTFVRIKL